MFVGVVMAIDTLWKVETLSAVWIAIKASLLCLVPSIIVDYFFYQKIVVAVANIFLYNSNARTLVSCPQECAISNFVFVCFVSEVFEHLFFAKIILLQNPSCNLFEMWILHVSSVF